ncbi:MAG: PDZ domain-containing protein, partial [Gemmatimonadaceae bacterium]|nr:PDZ domain-containing protein [Gemmatimonadaceae bacterium]
ESTAPRVQVLKDIELISLTAAIRAERGIRNAQGAVIVKVSDRVSDDLGIQAGDVIVQVNRTPITDAQQAARVLESLSGRGAVRMWFERGGLVYQSDFQVR